MRNVLKAALALGLTATGIVASTGASAGPLSTWYGRYVWEERIGPVGGSTPREAPVAFVAYVLSLGASAGATGCRVKIEGYQRYETMTCTATPQMNALVVKFYRFDADNIRRGRFALGAPLFTMTRNGRGLTTRLQALDASMDATPRSGRLFRQAG